MSAGADSTIPGRQTPVVVLVTPGPALRAACEKAIRCLDEVPSVKLADVTTVSTVIAEWRPFALIVPEPVFAFDPGEFESLAQAVAAAVLVVDPEQVAPALVAWLLPQLTEAFALWETKRATSPVA